MLNVSLTSFLVPFLVAVPVCCLVVAVLLINSFPLHDCPLFCVETTLLPVQLFFQAPQVTGPYPTLASTSEALN